MDLMSIEVSGYRRFAKPNRLQLNGKLVALVGPNEAGKSTLLKALEHVGNQEEISQEEITQGIDVETYIRAKYFISGDYLEKYGLDVPTWLNFKKNKDGSRNFDLVPKPTRDLTHRKIVLSILRKILKSKTAINAIYENNQVHAIKLMQEAIVLFQSDTYNFSDEDKETLKKLVDLFDDSYAENTTPSTANVRSKLESLITFEEDHNPHLKIGRDILSNMPPILQFSYSDRNLGIPFDLTPFSSGTNTEENAPNRALQRIIDLAELNLDDIATAVSSNNTAVTRGIIEEANNKLDNALNGRWSQSAAKIKFELTNNFLNLIVEHPEFDNFATKYNNYSDRSDGYKQFMALAVFAILENAEDSILLIDEADMHLHYDAQADLIQILTKQSLSKKVIYTTHSAGCLPEDLGNGVRLVEWDKEERNRSNIRNKFWSLTSSEGFSPLLLGMGATTFAFFPSRNAVVAEGVSEMILLAHVLREASGHKNLGFQIVPGLSNMKNAQLPLLGRVGSKVAYIVDNDPGGKALEKALKKEGIEANRIKKISKGKTFLTLEDCLEKDVWASAVNTYIAKYGESLGVSKITKFPNSNRIAALPRQLKDCKVDFCYNIQDYVFNNPSAKIVSSRAVKHLANVVTEIHQLFEQDA